VARLDDQTIQEALHAQIARDPVVEQPLLDVVHDLHREHDITTSKRSVYLTLWGSGGA
jgi:hypothetical protein